MSKYDFLDAKKELERSIGNDLKNALTKRGFDVQINASAAGYAPAGMADIVASNKSTVITFEGTKSRGAAQDRELNSIRDHLNSIKEDTGKKCFCVFISSDTSMRMLDGIRDHNQQRAHDGKPDLRILPLCFDTIELWTSRLRESEADLYPVAPFLSLFSDHHEFVDDLRIRKLLCQRLFPNDHELAAAIERDETDRDRNTLESLIKDLTRMENYLRENGIAVSHAAIETLIYLVFLKLYEEKRERSGHTNRLRSIESFQKYIDDSVGAPARRKKRAIHELFGSIKSEPEFVKSKMFTEGDNLADSVTDEFMLDYAIPVFTKYKFIGTRIDALGAVYEVLALRSDKDIKVGQFFTPENVVLFMTRMAALEYTDLVLDPACGTGRFLIYSMDMMLKDVERSRAKDRKGESEKVRLHRLFGADIDPRIAKIAKMNMWIHGDGKSNIFGGLNGLTLHRHEFDKKSSFDEGFDVVLTNPPLGNVNYQNVEFMVREADEDPQVYLRRSIKRIPILPTKDITADKMQKLRTKLKTQRDELAQMNQTMSALESDVAVIEWKTVQDGQLDKSSKARNKELAQNESVKAYGPLVKRAAKKLATIQGMEEAERQLDAIIRAGNGDLEITGNTMKGGPLFLASIWQYLKSKAYPDEKTEWRGGKVLIILDEGVLNTDQYIATREFIRTHFYIKAVVSLTRDTFVPISNTNTKTSIVFAVKKSDLQAVQKEPIFFAHVDRVGLTRVGKVCTNHLDVVLEKYRQFRASVLASYVGAEFRRDRFIDYQAAVGQAIDTRVETLDEAFTNYFFKSAQEKRTVFFFKHPDQVKDRLHYLFYHPKLAAIEDFARVHQTIALGAICREEIVRGEQPEYDEVGDAMVLKTVDLKNGHIDYDGALGVSQEFFDSKPLSHVHKGDILIASTGYMSMGKVDVYDREEPAMVDGHVSIVRVNDDYDPYFIAYFLRSHRGQIQFEKWFTGSSGQIELQPTDLGKILVPLGGKDGIEKTRQTLLASKATEGFDAARTLLRQSKEKETSAKSEFENAIFRLPS